MTEQQFAVGFTVTQLARAAGMPRRTRAADLRLVTVVLAERGWQRGDRGRWWPPSIRPIRSGGDNRGETVGEGFALRRARRARR